jgi:hypothetical protein
MFPLIVFYRSLYTNGSKNYKTNDYKKKKNDFLFIKHEKLNNVHRKLFPACLFNFI